MPYERSRRIEQRFQEALVLLKDRRVNARQLAVELDVSLPTVHRMITELRRRGHSVRSVHEGCGWAYELVEKPTIKQRTRGMEKE